MSTPKFWRIMMSMMAAVLLVSSFAATVSAATENAPAAQELRAQEVTGTMPGGQFAKIWLGLEPITPNEKIVIVSAWDRLDPGANGLGFYILTDEQLSAVQNGTNVREANLAMGSKLSPESPPNETGAEFQATSGAFTLVVFNDSNSDANFKITSENAFITDESGQVMDANAPVETPDADTAEGEEPAEDTLDETADEEAAIPEAAEETATPEPEAATTPEAEEATPVAVTTPGVIQAQELEGELPEQNDQHFLGLEPSVKDGKVDLVLAFDPQDSSELARRMNFWVLGQDAFNRYLDPNEDVILSNVATAAGSSDPQLENNQRSASFTSSGFGPYTVIVYNNSRVPATYSLRVDGGVLIDDSAQTMTAADSMTATTTVTGTVVSAEDETADAPAASTGREGEPGGTYTVQSGDTLSLIARDIYGDVGLWEELCAFNKLDDCNVLEVGDVLQLATTAELDTVAAAPAAAATPAPAATPEAEETPEAVETPAATAPVTSTTPVTTTTEVTTTDEMTDTAGTGDSQDASEATVDLVTQLEAQGSFTTLVDALEAAGLSDALQGAGPFTVFAPTDAAFDALPAGAMDQLMSNPTGQLTQILLFHVLPGEVTSEDITDGMQATTQQGKPVNFEITADGIKVNGANIIVPDIEAINGVVHAIDAVILPPPD